MGYASATLLLAIASISAVFSLLLVAIAFSTDHWVDTTVDRDKLKVYAASDLGLNFSLYRDNRYYTRYRGLFRTCYPGKDTFFLDHAEDVTDHNCLVERGYELDQNTETVDWGDEYETRVHLMRAHFAFFIVVMVLLVVACILGALGCYWMSPKLLRITGTLVFFAAFFAVGGMAFFHGYDYLEKEKIKQSPFPRVWRLIPVLDAHAKVNYGYSYILGWIGAGLAAIAAMLFLCAAFAIHGYDDDDDDDSDRYPLERKTCSYDTPPIVPVPHPVPIIPVPHPVPIVPMIMGEPERPPSPPHFQEQVAMVPVVTPPPPPPQPVVMVAPEPPPPQPVFMVAPPPPPPPQPVVMVAPPPPPPPPQPVVMVAPPPPPPPQPVYVVQEAPPPPQPVYVVQEPPPPPPPPQPIYVVQEPPPPPPPTQPIFVVQEPPPPPPSPQPIVFYQEPPRQHQPAYYTSHDDYAFVHPIASQPTIVTYPY